MKNSNLELELNSNDAWLDTNQIRKAKNVLKKTIANVLIGLTVFSGSCLGMPKVAAAETQPPAIVQQQDVSQSTVVDIPDDYKYQLASLMGKDYKDPITVKDLNELESPYLILHIIDDSSLEWMNHLKKVDEITFLLENEGESKTSPLKDIKKIDGVKDIKFATYETGSLTAEECAFLKNCKDCKNLSLYGVKIENGIVENLRQLEHLAIANQTGLVTSNIDFSKLTFLNDISFAFDGAYEAAINLSTEDYNKLTKAGVSIEFEDSNELNKLIEINKRLDDIVESLDVTKDSTDSEKLDAVLIYILENYEYSKEVSDILETKRDLIKQAYEDKERNNLTSISPEYEQAISKVQQELEDLTETFYEGGKLSAAMEGKDIICGNFTALTNALLDRLDVNSTYLSSGNRGNHAWTLVELDGQYYYVDSTWLDSTNLMKEETTTGVDEQGRKYTQTSFVPIPASEAIKSGETDELEWYKEDPTDFPESQTSPYAHDAINIPDYIQIRPITPLEEVKPTEEDINKEPIEEDKIPTEETKPIKIDEDSKFEVIIKDKRFIIGASATIGILTALGGAVAVFHHKKKKEAERRRQLYDNDPFMEYSSNYGDPFSDYSDPFSSSKSGSGNKHSHFGRR